MAGLGLASVRINRHATWVTRARAFSSKPYEVVVASLPQSEDLADARAEARTILTSTRADVTDDLEEALRRVEAATPSRALP